MSWLDIMGMPKRGQMGSPPDWESIFRRLREREGEVQARGRLGTQKGNADMWGQPAFMDKYGPGASQDALKEAATQIAIGAMTGPAGKGMQGMFGKLPMDEASRMARAKAAGFDTASPQYKGMWPYDWTKETGPYKGPEITQINRTTEFPAFNHGEPGVNLAGFMSSDPKIAARFAPPEGGAVYPLLIKRGKKLIIDAKGQHAANIQFGAGGKPFRDAVKSGKYDTIKIINTLDEGDISVAIKPENIRSIFAAFDPAKANSADLSAYAPKVLTRAPDGRPMTRAPAPTEAQTNSLLDAMMYDQGLKGKTSWHGSPHEFTKFSDEAIGTGEAGVKGAPGAYGYGHYFADRPVTAITYQKDLSQMRNSAAQRALAKHGGNADEAIKEAQAQIKRLEGLPNAGGDARRQAAQIAIQKEKIDVLRQGASEGHLYKTGLNVTDDTLLHWDKPLSEQPKTLASVRAYLDKTKGDPDIIFERLGLTEKSTGRELYESLGGITGNQQAASEFAKQTGIKGIKYLDQGSRAGGEGTYNYVVFDPKDTKILKMLGIGGAGMALNEKDMK